MPEGAGRLVRLHLVGVFAMWAEDDEASGARGASIHLLGQGRLLFRLDLVGGRHYVEADSFRTGARSPGDGSSFMTIGSTRVEGGERRVDLMSIDVPQGLSPRKLKFQDLGTAASFLIFEILGEYDTANVCPFRIRSGGVSLGEIGAILRIGDRVRFRRAIDQLEQGIRTVGGDLDEARGLALTFLAVVSASMLEAGAPRSTHRFQLDAARALERLDTVGEIAETTRELVRQVAGDYADPDAPRRDPLVERALATIDRNFARDITDASIAGLLGLSTSHFRFLFRQATDQPFHKYVISLRLEKARQMLVEGDLSVSDVARAVGFGNAAHFSRAFVRRFKVTPSTIRQNRG